MSQPAPARTVLAECLAEFNQVFEFPHPATPTADIPAETVALRVRLVTEEYQEFLEAQTLGDLHEIAKEAADLAYVLQGSADAFGLTLDPTPRTGRHAAPQPLDLDRVLTALQARDLGAISVEISDLLTTLRATLRGYGIALDIAVAQVHASNMSKLGADGQPIRDAGGKVLKGPGYQPADMRPALLGQPT